MGKIAQFRQKGLKWIEFKFLRDDVALEFRIPEPSYIEVQKIQTRLEKKYHVSRILSKIRDADSVETLSQSELDVFQAYDIDLLAEIVALFEDSFPSDNEGKLTMDDLGMEEVAEVFEAARQFFRRRISTTKPTGDVAPGAVQEARRDANK